MRGRVEERRRARHEVKARQQLIELDGARFAVCLVQRKTHRDAHEERLRQFEATVGSIGACAVNQEITVIKRLQTEETKIEVARVIECRAELHQVVARKFRIQQANRDAVFDELRKVFAIFRGHVGLGGFFAKDFEANGVEQQARRHETVSRIFFDVLASGQNRAFAHFFCRNAVIQIFKCGLENQVGVGCAMQAFAGKLDQLTQAQQIERTTHAVFDDMKNRLLVGFFRFGLQRTLLHTALTIEHVSAGDFMFARAHQRELNLILNFFDVNRAALWLHTHQRAHDGFGHLLRDLARTR